MILEYYNKPVKKIWSRRFRHTRVYGIKEGRIWKIYYRIGTRKERMCDHDDLQIHIKNANFKITHHILNLTINAGIIL